MKKFLLPSFVGAVFITISSCTFENVKPIPKLDPTDTISYKDDIKPFMDSYCVSCHSVEGGAPGDYTIFEEIQAAASSGAIKSRVFDLKDMPPDGMPLPTEEEKEKLRSWIEAGALNN